jgi:hypothetical protein
VTGRLGPPAIAVAVLVLLAPAQAATLALAERDRQEAVRLGQRSVVSDSFGEEWRVSGGPGQQLSVITPFHRLALAARHAAFRNEAFEPADQERVLREMKESLMLVVQLPGPAADFARFLRPRLLDGDREIAPAVVQNERTAAPQEDGRFLARCVYWFPSRQLAGTARLDLVVRDADDRPVARFPIDLGRMR